MLAQFDAGPVIPPVPGRQTASLPGTAINGKVHVLGASDPQPDDVHRAEQPFFLLRMIDPQERRLRRVVRIRFFRIENLGRRGVSRGL